MADDHDPEAKDHTFGGAAFRGATPPVSRLPLVVTAVALAVVGLALVSRTAQPDAAPTAGPSAAAIASLAPSAAPHVAVGAAQPNGPPPRNPGASPFPLVELADLPPGGGGTILKPFGSTAVRLGADVPAGWARAGDGMLVKDRGQGPTGASLSVWRAAHVNAYPCRWSSGVFAHQALGTLDGMANALAAWWGQDPGRLPYWNSPIAPLATRPVETALLGLPARRLEVLVPRGLDLAQCDGGQLVLWEATDGTARVGRDAGELHRLWVVGVGGGPIVVDAAAFPATSEQELDELEGILESLAVAP